MCAMRHILVFILLNCFTITIAKNEKKETKAETSSEQKKHDLTEVDYKEEAKRDLENLFKISKRSTDVDKNLEEEAMKRVKSQLKRFKRSTDVDKDFEEESKRNIDNLSKKSKRNTEIDEDLVKKIITTTFANDDKELDIKLDQLINKLDSRKKRHHTIRDLVVKRRNVYGIGDPSATDDIDMSPRGLYKKFLRNMNMNNKEGIKKRLSTTNNKLTQFTRQIDFSHRNAIKSKISENVEDAQTFFPEDENKAMRRSRDRTNIKKIKKIFVPIDRASGYYVPQVLDSKHQLVKNILQNSGYNNKKNMLSSEILDYLIYIVKDLYKQHREKTQNSMKDENEDEIFYRLICRINHKIQNAIAEELGIDRYQNTQQSADDDCTIAAVPVRPRPVRKGHPGKRFRRAIFTQAGYTQDPDTCKTYNENLAKLWSNLSKLLFISEQPNLGALHNIAMMVQAYIDHENTKPPHLYNTKTEETTDKVDEVIHKIKIIIEDAEASPKKITETITKFIKPIYVDVENIQCQQLNEESLFSAVELLYRNYLKNAECLNDGHGMVRTKQLARTREIKDIQKFSSSPNNWNPPDTAHKPDVISDAELYQDFLKGKFPRKQISEFDSRRVFKGNKKHMSLIYRSGNQNTNVTEKQRERSKSSKGLKSSLKTSAVKNSCEQYSLRKFTVSLRPVIERFMSLLECQLDNTLRSIEPYYLLYASKYDSKEYSPTQTKNMPKNNHSRDNSSGSSNNFLKKFNDIEHHHAQKLGKVVTEHSDDYNYQILRKYNLQENAASSIVDSFSTLNQDEDDSNNEYLLNDDDIYFQSQSLYDDYEDNDSSQITPIDIDKTKDSKTQSTNKDLELTSKEQASNIIKEIVSSVIERNIANDTNYNQPFIEKNITKKLNLTSVEELRVNDQLPNVTLRQSQAKSYETLADFLRKARDESLLTPEFAVPFALDSNKGYVEVTHLVKHHRTLIYRPQFLVKNTIPYEDFLKTINNFSMTNDEVRLMKIVRHLPDGTVQVLFETKDFEPPLEFHNVKDSRRSSEPKLTDETVNRYRFNNSGFKNVHNAKIFALNYRDQARSHNLDLLFKNDRADSDENNSQSDFNTDTDTNFTSSISPESSASSGSVSGFGSNSDLDSDILSAGSSESETNSSSSERSSVGSGIDATIIMSPALPLKPMPSYYNKLNSKSISTTNSSSFLTKLTNSSSFLSKLTNTVFSTPAPISTSPSSWWSNWQRGAKQKVQVTKLSKIRIVVGYDNRE